VKALAFWKNIIMDQVDFLDRVIALLSEHNFQYCVIGGQGVNAYVDPVVSLDLDLVIAVDQLVSARTLFETHFEVQEFTHSLNVYLEGSELRVQIQTDPRYGKFPGRASRHTVLGLELPVASLEDIFQGKVWAASDPERRASKRQKDLADISRLLEAYPALRPQLPPEILSKMV